MKPLKDNNQLSYKGHSKTTGIQAHIENELPNFYNVPDHDILVLCTNKAQKIATATYLITDLIGEADPLVQKLRTHAIALTDDLYETATLKQAQRTKKLADVAIIIKRLVSYFEILKHTGKVSDMNHALVSKELDLVLIEVQKMASRSLPYDRQKSTSRLVNEFSFSEDFFETSGAVGEKQQNFKDSVQKQTSSVKDINTEDRGDVKDNKKEDVFKDKEGNLQKSGDEDQIEKEEEFKKNKKTTSQGHKKISHSTLTKNKKTKASKEVRHENILKILKQKKDAQIGDITSLITDYGSKTIQRDLNELVKKRLVSKEGERRWSVYNLNY